MLNENSFLLYLKMKENYYFLNSKYLKREEICEKHNFIIKKHEKNVTSIINFTVFLKKINKDNNIEIDKITKILEKKIDELKCGYQELRGWSKYVDIFRWKNALISFSINRSESL